ncbi:MAG: radical SAM family heme chaperone HemW, partial [Syntrophomonadaceae bacterium]|nr:radical SAM family heme chaperone HemW [Syntrophomonadaceae bacterium]
GTIIKNSKLKIKNSPTIGIYIHIPFCIRKCSYCDFFSLPLQDQSYLDKYTQALLNEIKVRRREMPAVQLESIYLGGGTPSLLNGQQLKSILQTVANEFTLLPGAEISLEANPATLDKAKLAEIEEAGINRISLGVQSFFDDELALLGRIHNANAVMETIELLHALDWKNFNLDLIYGLPGQSQDKWLQSLKQALDCSPSHLSLYLLQLEEQTPMGKDVAGGRLKMLDEDDEWYMFDQAMEYLEGKKFEHYEISNFCRTGYECRHNLRYWQAEEYLGLGAGAVSFINGSRFINEPHLKQYVETLLIGEQWPVKELEQMSGRELMIDALILGLRLCAGIDLEQFQQRFGVDITSEYKEIIAYYRSRGLLNIVNGHLKFTKAGYFLSNQVLCQFIA